ncbi:MAG: tail fiber domain-containing protein [Gemmatimonadota bacterium]
MHTTIHQRIRPTLAATMLALPLLAAALFTSPLAAQTPLIVSRNAIGDSVMIMNDDGGFAVMGQFGNSAIPVQGVGVRLMWYPGKGAFRAGRVTNNYGGTGTEWDDANIGDLSVAMGDRVMASGNTSIALGLAAQATGQYAVALGYAPIASGYGTTAMGSGAVASGIDASALGAAATASGDYSLALGTEATTDGFEGAVVIGDAAPLTVGGDTMRATANNQFSVRASGGIRLRTSYDTISGCDIDGAGNMTCTGTINGSSDVNRKTDFAPVNADQVLKKLADLPIGAWSYKRDPAGVRHVGPMAQAFHAAFGLGANDVTIATVDADGVNMLAIQALERRTVALQKQVDAERAANGELKQRVARLEAVVKELRAKDRNADAPAPE